MRLRAAEEQLGWRHEHFDALGSTNDEAMARARSGDFGRLWITATTQTAGRGRLGRVWSSPPGNLCASLLLIDPAPPDRVAQLGFVAGVALIEALQDITRAGERLALKWPNDVLFDGGKLAGILLESAMLAADAVACVAGFGVNCAAHPEGLPYPAHDLSAFGATASREIVFAALAEKIPRWLAKWDNGRDFAHVRAAWLRHAAGIGDTIEVNRGARRLGGRFQGLDMSGRLMLATASGEIAIDAGDVYLGAGDAEIGFGAAL